MLEVRVKRVGRRGEPLPLPRYQTGLAAGLDLHADIEDTTVIAPGERLLVPTGIALEIPAGYEGQVRPRSGLALRYGVTLLNSPGTIDADYRGELQVLLIHHGDQPFELQRGDRIAQLIIAPVARVVLRETEEIAASPRGSGGFGHTGSAA